MNIRRLKSRTNALWFVAISRLLPRQTVAVYRQGDRVSLQGTDAELVGVYDCTTEVDRLWADVEAHATEALKAAA